MKQLSKTEKTSIIDCAPAYFEYLLAQGADTCLAKILGVFQVHFAMPTARSPALVSHVIQSESVAKIAGDNAANDLKLCCADVNVQNKSLFPQG